LQSAATGPETLKLGTRGSPLALAQAEMVRAALGALGRPVEIVPIRTTGDRITDRPLAEAGGKGLFTKEIDAALISGAIDFAVHSAKDLPTALPEGIVIAACMPRADCRDAFLSPRAETLRALPEGAVVGTASLRRAALALRLRPDLKIVPMRGNVGTRLAKLEAGEADATILALAGLIRLGLAGRATTILDPDDWLPAPGQGTVAITARAEDAPVLDPVVRIDDSTTAIALFCERAFLAVLDGSCRTPIGGLAEIDGDALRFRGIIVKPDGSVAHEVVRRGAIGEAQALGADAAAELARAGGPDFFAG
jgi:hydroxymethylbilane synthase